MPTPGKSTVFSNGTEYECFLESYCLNCYRYKVDADDFPARNSCRIEKAMAERRWNDKIPWPKEIVQTETQWHHCPLFIDKKDYEPAERHNVPMENQIEIEVK